MAEFAKYAFNKSHAAAYAVIAYQTAYLKAHYPHEFMAALMNSMLGNLNKIPEYIEECKDLNIEVLKPDINESYARFAVINKKIRFALVAIKNVGENAIKEIVNERKRNGKFLSFIDFCERVSGEQVNKKCIESLIMAGAFDELDKEVNRFDLLENYESIVDNVTQTKRNNYINQINLFDSQEEVKASKVSIKKCGKTPSKRELLDMEKEMLGLYVSGHPLDEYIQYISKNATITSKDLSNTQAEESRGEEYKEENIDSLDDTTQIFCGILTKVKLLTTKSNKQMMFAEIEDMYGSIEVVIFPNIYLKFSDMLQKDNILKITGKINIKENEKPKILASNIEQLTIIKKIYIRLPKDKLDLEDRVIKYISNLESEFKGNAAVYIFYEGTNKLKVLNRENWLNTSSETLEKLKIAFGEENVKVK